MIVAFTAERINMAEWIWLVIGAAWGLWVNLGDAKYYKNIMDLQTRYIKLLHKQLDEKNMTEGISK